MVKKKHGSNQTKNFMSVKQKIPKILYTSLELNFHLSCVKPKKKPYIYQLKVLI